MDLQALHTGPNLMAIFAAVVVAQLVGFVFYNPKTFSKPWLKAWKLDAKKINKKDPAPFVISILSTAFMAMTLDYLMRHLGWTGALGGLRAALYIWTGFIALGTATHYRFAQVSARALLLDLAYDLLALCATGLILGVWR